MLSSSFQYICYLYNGMSGVTNNHYFFPQCFCCQYQYKSRAAPWSSVSSARLQSTSRRGGANGWEEYNGLYTGMASGHTILWSSLYIFYLGGKQETNMHWNLVNFVLRLIFSFFLKQVLKAKKPQHSRA